MGTISFRIDDEKKESIEAEADERDMSRAAYVKSIVERRHEYGADVEELHRENQRLQQRVDELEQKRDSLRKQVEVATSGDVYEYTHEINKILDDFKSTLFQEVKEIRTQSHDHIFSEKDRTIAELERDVKRVENQRLDMKSERDRAVAERQKRLRTISARLTNIEQDIDELQTTRYQRLKGWVSTRVNRVKRLLSVGKRPDTNRGN